MVRKDHNLLTHPWGMLMVRNKLNSPVHHPCDESHTRHRSHHGRKSYCLSRGQQQLSCSHIKKNPDFNRKWGCCKKSLSLVFTLTTGSRDWKNHRLPKDVALGTSLPLYLSARSSDLQPLTLVQLLGGFLAQSTFPLDPTLEGTLLHGAIQPWDMPGMDALGKQ